MGPLSPDGRWRWDGERWVPTRRPPSLAIVPQPTAIRQGAQAAERTAAAAEPTEVAAEPTEAAAEPTVAAAEPTVAAAEPTEAGHEPTEAGHEPTEAAPEARQEQEAPVLNLDDLTIVAPAPLRPSPLPSLDRPAWLDGEVDMPWLTRPRGPAQPQEARPRFSVRRRIAELRRRMSLSQVGVWQLIAGALACLSLLLMVLVVAAMLWQRLHV